jgi:RNA polymerase sigma factor for flagellar operon FliA
VSQKRGYSGEYAARSGAREVPQEQDEASLWKRYRQGGDKHAKDALVLKYLQLAKYIAGRMAIHLPPQIDERDVVGWAVVGLLEAAEKYDPDHTASFSTFASYRIKGSIRDSVRQLDWLPRLQRQKVKKVSAAAEKLRAALGREPQHDEIAHELGVAVEEVRDNLLKLKSAELLSLDQPLGGDSGSAGDEQQLTLENVVRDSSESPVEIVEKRSKLEALAEAIPQLTENQQRVIYLYYNEELTLKEVARVLDLTEGRVCQIHKEAIEKLRGKMARWSID